MSEPGTTIPRARRLWRVAEAIRRRTMIASFAGSTVGHRTLVDSCMFYVRSMVLQGRATAVVVDTGPAEAAYPNLRALLEYLVDFMYLLSGTPAEQESKALRIQLHGRRDLLEYSAKTDFDPQAVVRMRQNVAELAALDPATGVAFELDWGKGKRSHWSGYTRTEVMRMLDTNPFGLAHHYKIYSWMAHPGVGPVTGVAGDLSHSRIADHSGHEKTGRFVCGQAISMLISVWRRLRSQPWFQNQPPIPLLWAFPPIGSIPPK